MVIYILVQVKKKTPQEVSVPEPVIKEAETENLVWKYLKMVCPCFSSEI